MSVHLYVCVSFVTLVLPAKAVGWSEIEMPLGSDSHVVPSNIVLDRGPGPPTGRRDFGIGTPSQNFQRKLQENRYR